MKDKQEKLPVLKEETSECFHRAFCQSASLVIDCEFCGRTFFASNYQGDYEEGEFAKLQAKAEKEPDRYIEGSDYWSWYHLGGKQFVVGCPCNASRHYENFIWRNRRQISTYLRTRTSELLRMAKADAETVNEIPEKL